MEEEEAVNYRNVDGDGRAGDDSDKDRNKDSGREGDVLGDIDVTESSFTRSCVESSDYDNSHKVCS